MLPNLDARVGEVCSKERSRHAEVGGDLLQRLALLVATDGISQAVAGQGLWATTTARADVVVGLAVSGVAAAAVACVAVETGRRIGGCGRWLLLCCPWPEPSRGCWADAVSQFRENGEEVHQEKILNHAFGIFSLQTTSRSVNMFIMAP